VAGVALKDAGNPFPTPSEVRSIQRHGEEAGRRKPGVREKQSSDLLETRDTRGKYHRMIRGEALRIYLKRRGSALNGSPKKVAMEPHGPRASFAAEEEGAVVAATSH